MNIMKKKVYCSNEYEQLRRVIVCRPTHMKIAHVINETQKLYVEENIDVTLALKQHDQFVKTLQKYDVQVVAIPPSPQFTEQVFTRDIGFTIGETVCIADMSCDVRQGEEQVLKEWLKTQHIPYIQIEGTEIEGGDVIVDGQKIYVGMSHRTTQSSVRELSAAFPSHEVIPISFNPRYLHLDCVFSILSKDEALLFPTAFNKEELSFFHKQYDCIEVSSDEQFTLGANILSIGNKTIISLPLNQQVNEALRRRGYRVEEVDFSEIIKSGGAFRCCSLPLLRGGD